MLDLNAIRAEFAGDLSADPLRHGLDRAFAASVERAYRQGCAMPNTAATSCGGRTLKSHRRVLQQ